MYSFWGRLNHQITNHSEEGSYISVLY